MVRLFPTKLGYPSDMETLFGVMVHFKLKAKVSFQLSYLGKKLSYFQMRL